MKYGIWNVGQPNSQAVNALVSAGYPPLVAMILAARGKETEKDVKEYIGCDGHLHDPYLLKDMDLAAGRVGLAMARGERIAVFGDYDVDGITATCLLTLFLRSLGADCIPYIPGRLEEGYGLNPIAIHQLHGQGVQLIITVDCGITALEEAKLCKQLGIDLVITDHHECKEELPEAVAIVDAHRKDCRYPHTDLSGVGVAFKLAAALSGNQQTVLDQYADLVALGTVADVMPLTGENRVFVSQGLEQLNHTSRPGIAALMQLCGCENTALTANSIGYTLAPRINAAGRMGQIDLALQLLLTQEKDIAEEMAHSLCELNRKRQEVEAQIYKEAVSMLPQDGQLSAIVLAKESWHQGVVGIVASRLAEEYSCPAFLICLDGDHGKASSRSHGGFNLFSALRQLSHLLESYGGHELAAGFTVHKDNIPAFREAVTALAEEFYQEGTPRTCLEADCQIEPQLLTLPALEALDCMEPCGNGCPRPVVVVPRMQVENIMHVGNGRHLRLRLRRDRFSVNAIWFGVNAKAASLELGDVVDVACYPQINIFRDQKSVQLGILDIRPSCKAEVSVSWAGYVDYLQGRMTPQQAEALLPDREELALVWRYLSQRPQTEETAHCLCRKIVRWAEKPMSVEKLLLCLDIFRDVGLLEISRKKDVFFITVCPVAGKADLEQSVTMQNLQQIKRM